MNVPKPLRFEVDPKTVLNTCILNVLYTQGLFAWKVHFNSCLPEVRNLPDVTSRPISKLAVVSVVASRLLRSHGVNWYIKTHNCYSDAAAKF